MHSRALDLVYWLTSHNHRICHISYHSSPTLLPPPTRPDFFGVERAEFKFLVLIVTVPSRSSGILPTPPAPQKTTAPYASVVSFRCPLTLHTDAVVPTRTTLLKTPFFATVGAFINCRWVFKATRRATFSGLHFYFSAHSSPRSFLKEAASSLNLLSRNAMRTFSCSGHQ